ncbi:MAG: Eco57I restriction-modification methylase domain-containing protein [Caldisericia bacterium]|nr:Eco57I restriction-modification methylase domain-containing protein [Caldisericia bacterium]
MKEKILKDVIEDFQIDKFARFFRAKNNKFRFPNEPLYCKDDNFKKATKIAESNLEDGNLIVCSFLVQQPLPERSGKKAQYELGKKILKESQTDAGIFIFYDVKGSFRFSLIYTNYLGTHRDWSNFKRFTYLVSPELTNKTFLEQIGEGDFSTLETIKKAFSVEPVTKQFYQEIANWYFWAVQESKFPEDAEKEENGRNISIIRLITRIIFIWFMREQNLISHKLFDYREVSNLLNDLSANSSTFYKAILQNLFFATLNTKTKGRKFRFQKTFQGKNQDYMDHTVYRYEKYFKNKEEAIILFKDIPFLNGGLFNCLDKRITENGINKEIRIDGFTDKEVGLNVPNFLFFSDEKNVDLNKEYGTKNKKYKVQGLVNILSSYNFTIDENVPDDQEVALDPELLGKVFENLLASYNPETATTARKVTGSYYTPREIVDYMVSESLKEYFKTHLRDIEVLDTKLNNLFSTEQKENPFTEQETRKIVGLIDVLRIVDPAVGSGAFPMGILNKLVFILSKLDSGNKLWKEAQLNALDKSITDPVLKNKLKEQTIKQFAEKNSDYGRKLYLIQKCIYGVDIQQIAVEIAKLRFFISLLVDEKIVKNKENWGIEPLPNLDFKIMQGNSLISEFMGINLDDDEKKNANELFKYEISELIENFHNKKNEFQNESNEHKKDILIREINELIIKIFEEKLKIQKANFFRKIKEIEEKYSKHPNKKQREEIIEKEKHFLYEKEGFNLESAERQLKEFTEGQKTKPFFAWKLYFAEVFQEKGGFDIVIGNPPYIKEYTFRNAFNELRKSPYYQGKMDIWYLFACKGIDLLKKNSGVLTYIAQNNWVTSYGASKMRNKIIKDTHIIQMIDFGSYKIFESSGIQTMIMMFKADLTSDNYTFDYRRLEGDGLNFNDVLDLLKRNPNSKTIYLKPTIQRNKFLNKPLIFSSTKVDKIFNKLFEQSNFKLTENEIAQGIVAPQDYVIKSHLKKIPNLINGEGIFFLTDKEKNRIPFTEEELELIKPSYTTKELRRYYANRKNTEWVIYTDSRFKNPESIKPYPNIKRHLDKFQKVITSDNKPYGLHRARDERFFKGEKIVAVRKCKKPAFTYADFDCYLSATFYLIKTERINLKYLTALLNSKLIAFWLKYKGKMQGDNYQIDKEPLLALPLKIIPTPKQQPFIALVDKILAITKDEDYLDNSDKQSRVKEYERQIDLLVYELYGLTEEEIKIIEGIN